MRPVVFSIVLPCYNEAGNLPPLLERYREVWQDLPAELILVDNGSTDDTAAVLARELARPELGFARSVRVEHNRGYGHGIHTGLLAARGRYLGYSHADQQCNPADLFTAYHLLVGQADPEKALVKGKRARRELGAELLTGTLSAVATTVLGTLLTDINAQPKVFCRSHLERLTQPPLGFEYDLYVLFEARRAGLRILPLPVRFGRRGHGQSKWAFSLASRARTIRAMLAFVLELRTRRHP